MRPGGLWRRRAGLLAAVAALLLANLGFFLWYRSTSLARAASLEARRAALAADVDGRVAEAARLTAQKDRLSGVSEAIEEFYGRRVRARRQSLAPVVEEIHAVLKGAGVAPAQISYTTAPLTDPPVVEMRVAFAFKGDYARLKQLLAAFESNRRWIVVREIGLVRDPEVPGAVNVQVKLVTYFAAEESAPRASLSGERAMKAGSLGTRRQLFMLGILGAVLILALVKWGGRSSAPSRAAGPASAAVIQNPEEDRPAARRPRKAEKKEITWEDVEVVTVQDLEPPRSRRAPEAGRNIFDFRAPTVAPLPTPTPAPPPPPAPGSAGFVGPVPPPPPTPTPLPPEIPFKFIGTFGPRDRSIAVLVLGDQIVNARTGDIVFERFLIKRVGYESIDVGFVGPWTETKRLGITP